VKVQILCPAHAGLEDIELPKSYGTGGSRRFQGEIPCAKGDAILEIDVNIESGHVGSVRYVRDVANATPKSQAAATR
jgi:hypothetical protein